MVLFDLFCGYEVCHDFLAEYFLLFFHFFIIVLYFFLYVGGEFPDGVMVKGVVKEEALPLFVEVHGVWKDQFHELLFFIVIILVCHN